MGRETYFPHLAILVPERQSCACLRGQYTLRKIITRHSDHVPRLNLHSPAAPPVPHFPRFRALALFGRRPPQRVDSLVMPASENLHKARNRCAIARCAGSPTASAVTGGKIVKTQNRCALVRSLRRCGLSANMMVADRTVHIRAQDAEGCIGIVKNLNDGHPAIGEAEIILTRSLKQFRLDKIVHAFESNTPFEKLPGTQINVPRLNLHSARGTTGAPLPAISCLGAFRTPVAAVRG